MFSFFNRSRRHVAVLAALAMLASVLVAAPAVAADDPPEPDLTATFTACVDVPSSGFTDVPAGYANAGDIDCIAYYTITKGTSATTYSPLMSVTREHMALFLARLAGRVGIELTSTPDDPGFTDTGELGDNSQLAIAQLASHGIAKGTTTTTYSPGASVTRGQMALFISRLMNLMTPYGGDDSDDAHTPSDVADLNKDDVGAPFNDIDTVTVRTNTAITELYELGVASGVSGTAYAPLAPITRAAMAKFMVGVMDHSNLRPAGLSIQTSKPSSFGDNEGDAVVSVRDDSFAPIVDQVVDIFLGDLDEDGACDPACVWDDGTDEELTDEDGNIVSEGGASRGDTNTYYAWIGSEDEEEFDVDDTDHVSVSVESKNEEQAMKVSTSISDNADGETADLDKGGSVVVTVQLVDKKRGGDNEIVADDAADDAKNVARAGIEITVAVTRTVDDDDDADDDREVVYSSTDVMTLTTDDDGKATFIVDAPVDDDDVGDIQAKRADNTVNPAVLAVVAAELENRNDEITFTYKDGGAGNLAAAAVTILWIENDPVTTSASSSAAAYVIPSKGDVVIRTSITLYDQYGNGIREAGNGQMAAIDIDTANDDDDNDNVEVNRNGVATRRKVIKDAPDGTPIPITFDARPMVDDDDEDVLVNNEQTGVTAISTADAAKLPNEQSVQVVFRADDDDAGAVVVTALLSDDDEFLANTRTDDDDDATATSIAPGSPNRVFSYDSGDTFVNGVPNGDSEGELLTMEKFEEMLGDGLDLTGVEESAFATVDVVFYNPDGTSIFKVTVAAREGAAPPG